MSPAEDVLALARRLATGPNLTNLNERLHLLLTATPDNVKRDNMSDQPNDNQVTLRPPPGYAWQDGELIRVFSEGGHTAALRDFVNDNRETLGLDKPGSPRQVAEARAQAAAREMTDRIISSTPPAPPLDPPGGAVAAYRTAYLAKARDLGLDERGAMPPTRDQLSECIAAGITAANATVSPHQVAALGPHDYSNPGGAGLVLDIDGRLEVQWTDRSAHVAITPDVVEGFVKQVNKLRADVAKWTARAEAAEEFASDLADWSNAIATRVPEAYEGSEGTQEGCIGTWLDDLEQVAQPFAAELRAHADIGDAVGDLVVPIPADPTEQEHLFNAAARLGGE